MNIFLQEGFGENISGKSSAMGKKPNCVVSQQGIYKIFQESLFKDKQNSQKVFQSSRTCLSIEPLDQERFHPVNGSLIKY